MPPKDDLPGKSVTCEEPTTNLKASLKGKFRGAATVAAAAAALLTGAANSNTRLSAIVEHAKTQSAVVLQADRQLRSAPLLLIAAPGQPGSTLLAQHESHASHVSHVSHASHQSHASHYSSAS